MIKIDLELVGSYAPAGSSRSICVHRDVAYLGAEDEKIYVVSVANPATPVLATTITGAFNHPTDNTLRAMGAIKHLAVYGTTLYASSWDGYLFTFDVSSPSSPVQIGYYRTPHVVADESCGCCVVKDTYAYLAAWDGGVCILDLNTGPRPYTRIGVASNSSSWCAVDDNNVLWSAGESNLRTFNVSDPTTPVLLATYNGFCSHVFFDGQWVYVGFPTVGQKIFPKSNTTTLAPSSTIASASAAAHCCVADGALFLLQTEAHGGIEIFNIADPNLPVQIPQTVAVNASYHAVYIKPYLYVVSGGMRIYSRTDTAASVQTKWITRRLNRLVDDRRLVSLNSNQFTLKPGSYRFRITAPACGVGRHQARLRNMVTGKSVLGTSEAVPLSGQAQSRSLIIGRIEVRPGDRFEVQHICSSPRQIYGLGRAGDAQDDALYTVAEFWPETAALSPGNADIAPVPRGFNAEQSSWMEEMRQEVIALSAKGSKGYIRLEDRRSPGVQGGGFNA